MSQKDSKALKKAKVEDEDDDESIASFAKRSNKSPKNSNVTPISRTKVKKEEKKAKKEEDDEVLVKKTTSKKAPNKTENKKMKKEEEEEKKKKKEGKAGENKEVKKREKKVFDLPGQKREPPEERDPLRIFYETLYKQVPASEMAAIWMMETGLLPKDEAKKVFDKKQKKTLESKLSSPMKTVVTVKRKANSITIENKSATSPVSSTQKKKTTPTPTPVSKAASKKRRSQEESSNDEDDDDDFVVDTKKSKKKQRVS